MKQKPLIGADRFTKFNFKDRISKSAFSEFERKYESFVQMPTIANGWLARSSSASSTATGAAYVIRSQKNIRQKQSRATLESYIPTKIDQKTGLSSDYTKLPWNWPIKSSNIFGSKSGNKYALINKINTDPDNSSSKPSTIIEIYNNIDGNLTNTIIADSSNLKMHGKMYSNGPFSGISWSDNEKYIAFIAERAQIYKKDKFFKNVSQTETLTPSQDNKSKDTKNTTTKEDDGKEDNNNNNEKDETLYGESFTYEDDFAEQMDGAKSTTLFIYSLLNDKLYNLGENIPNDAVLGECIFAPDNESVVCVAYDTYPRRLGIKFYNTRPSQLWHIKLKLNNNDDGNNNNECEFDLNETKIDVISGENDFSPQCPRFSPNGEKLIYLTTNKTWLHRAASKIQCIEWKNGKFNSSNNSSINTIIDIPNFKNEYKNENDPNTTAEMNSSNSSKDCIEYDLNSICDKKLFPGLYTYFDISLPYNCFLDENGNNVVFSALWTHEITMFIVNLNNKTIKRFDSLNIFDKQFEYINKNENTLNLFVLDCDFVNNKVLFYASSMQRPFSVHIWESGQNFNNNNNDNSEEGMIHTLSMFDENSYFENLTLNNQNDKNDEKENSNNNNGIFKFQDIKTSILRVPIKDDRCPNIPFVEALYVEPPKSVKLYQNDPIILLYPHGGPHSASVLAHSWAVSLLLDSGISVIFPNYRGSIGYGEIFSHSLLGNVSDMDVKDCMSSFDYIKNVFINNKNKNTRNAVMGGSHGGFLVGHLIGQYPNVFEVASTRNPVLNILLMTPLTDITDWNYLECGIKFDYPNCLMRNLNINEINILYKKSPQYYINNVITPLQLLVGKKDQRVPMQQSIDYYKILKPKLQNKIRLLMYPDCQHSLNDTIEQESDVWANIWCWIHYWMRCQNNEKNEKNEKNDGKDKNGTNAVNQIDQLLSKIDNTD